MGMLCAYGETTMARPIGLVGLVCLGIAPIAFAQTVDLRDPRTEAEYLSLEISGELRPPAALAYQIQADLEAIRSEYPQLADIHVLPSWVPGELLVGLTTSAYSQFKSGTFNGFDSLYAELGTPASRAHDTGQWVHLQFGQVYHGSRLAELFQAASGVRYADPNGILGDGDDIVARANRTYTLSRGFGDCPAGCIDRESWDFTVTNDRVYPGTSGPPANAPGDFNNNGVVDAADYVVWRNGAGSIYNQTHYAGWRSNFGVTVVASRGLLVGAQIPEPTGCMMLTLGLIPMLLRRHEAGNRFRL
jgi:hypothetical protein